MREGWMIEGWGGLGIEDFGVLRIDSSDFWDAVVSHVQARFPNILAALQKAELSPIKDD